MKILKKIKRNLKKNFKRPIQNFLIKLNEKLLLELKN